MLIYCNCRPGEITGRPLPTTWIKSSLETARNINFPCLILLRPAFGENKEPGSIKIGPPVFSGGSGRFRRLRVKIRWFYCIRSGYRTSRCGAEFRHAETGGWVISRLSFTEEIVGESTLGGPPGKLNPK